LEKKRNAVAEDDIDPEVEEARRTAQKALADAERTKQEDAREQELLRGHAPSLARAPQRRDA
jgi:hypothetical protein